VDDAPYGGGAGMVLQVQPIFECLKTIGVLSLRGAQRRSNPNGSSSALTRGDCFVGQRPPRNDKTKVIALDPAGKKFDQAMAQEFSQLDRLVMVCGRYQGFDERVYEFVDEKISVGDFVLSGGELPALIITEAVSRLIPGVLGNEESLVNETFGNYESRVMSQELSNKIHDSKFVIPDSAGEHPLYTRPENFMGLKVPEVLLSGDHKKIAEWRESQK
jgi:tRNA (guanine37-N1)-methyltransferase